MSVREGPNPSLLVDTDEILAALTDTIALVDARSRLVAVNRPDSPVFRTRPSNGDSLDSAFDPTAASLIRGLIEKADGLGLAEGEYGAGARYFGVSARPLRSAPVTLLIFQDVTVRRNAERAITESIGDKTSVLKSISQQLGAPLIAVLGYASLLTEPGSDLDAATRDAMAQHMTDQAWELAGMVENVQAMAQTELGDLRVVTVPVSLSANVAQVIESMGVRGSRVMVTGNRAVTAVGDPARVRQIVRNLLSNALTHGAEPITIDVSATETHSVVSVKDRGSGIPQALEREIFSRTPSFGQDRSGRAGIGLWAAAELADLMGGEIEYRRELGMTVFRLTLPLV